MYLSRKLTPKQIAEAIHDYAHNRLSGSALATKYGVSRAGMDKILKAHGVQFRSLSEAKRIYTLNEAYFSVIDTEEKAYILGFLYGDGYVTPLNTNICITGLQTDEQILRDMAIALGSNRPLRYRLSKSGKSTHAIFAVSSKRMRGDLFKLGVVPNKTKIITFPHNHIPPQLRRHFIRGLFDADGCITSSKDRRCVNRINAHWNIFSTREMLNSIKAIMTEENVPINTMIRDKRCYLNSAILCTAKAATLHDIYHYLYTGATLRLERKQLRFQAILALKPREGLVAARRKATLAQARD